MKNLNILHLILICASLVFLFSCTGPTLPEYSFTTGGETVYHIGTGMVKKTKKAVITASIHGEVQAFTLDGDLIWQTGTDGGFPFDICIEDIDNDGLDETLLASGNGSLYAIDNDGKSLWTFSGIPPLYQVSVAKDEQGNAVILTGGPAKVLYALSPEGEVNASMPTEHCIRLLGTGDVKGEGKDYLAMTTTSSGLSGILSLYMINPTDLSVVWKRTNLGNWAANTGKRFFSMLVKDLNRNGFDDIILSGGWGENGRVYAYDHNGDDLFMSSDEEIPIIPYRMNLLRPVNLPEDTCILGHFGNYLIVYELDGELREVLHGNYSFADVYFDEDERTLFMGSEVSGGDGIYALRMDQPDWQEKYESIVAKGRMAEIEENLAIVKDQIRNFVPPSYQPEPADIMVISRKPQGMKFDKVDFISATRFTQQITDPDELWCRDTDRRMRYDMSLEEMIERVSKMEEQGRDFIIWAGHGAAVYFPFSSFEPLIKAAPNHLRGFEFAEMESTSEHMQEVVTKILFPVAELCKKYDKFLVFRNKNIFWNGTCYLPFWRRVLLNEKYRDVIIPGLEETNCRTQELSLVGRIGLWQTGAFNRWACRMVTDNSNFDRMFEWGGQQVLTHHLRNLVSTASLGAEVFFNNIHAGPDSDTLYTQLAPFYEMMEKGIISVPAKDELLSLSGLALGMKDPPSETYLKHGKNGHNYWFPETGKTDMVFNKLDTYFGGSSLDPFDYSKYAFNVERRMTNFLPETPYGMTAIVPSETETGERFHDIIVTDGEFFYDENGNKHTAAEYKETVLASLVKASEKLPVLVNGEAHWSAVRLDPEHIRMTLIDPGYLDPSEREAEIVLQNIEGLSCTDILSRENLKIEDGKIRLTIPAGVFRILDIEHPAID